MCLKLTILSPTQKSNLLKLLRIGYFSIMEWIVHNKDLVIINCEIRFRRRYVEKLLNRLEMYVSPVPDKISTKFQRLYLCFRGPTFNWNPREYYATKPEGEKAKTAAFKLAMHASPLPDKLSTIFQRLQLRFRGPTFHWDYYVTELELEKSKSQITGKFRISAWVNRSPTGDWGQRWVSWWVGSYVRQLMNNC